MKDHIDRYKKSKRPEDREVDPFNYSGSDDEDGEEMEGVAPPSMVPAPGVWWGGGVRSGGCDGWVDG